MRKLNCQQTLVNVTVFFCVLNVHLEITRFKNVPDIENI